MYGRNLRRHRTVAKEFSDALLSVWTAVKVDPQVYGVVALAIVATEVNFVCRHVRCFITRLPHYKTTTVKLLALTAT
jgi:hypothetical protein